MSSIVIPTVKTKSSVGSKPQVLSSSYRSATSGRVGINVALNDNTLEGMNDDESQSFGIATRKYVNDKVSEHDSDPQAHSGAIAAAVKASIENTDNGPLKVFNDQLNTMNQSVETLEQTVEQLEETLRNTASSEQFQSISTQIQTLNQTITAAKQSIALMSAKMASKADTSTVQSLTQRVNSTESRLNDKASTQQLGQVSEKVNQISESLDNKLDKTSFAGFRDNEYASTKNILNQKANQSALVDTQRKLSELRQILEALKHNVEYSDIPQRVATAEQSLKSHIQEILQLTNAMQQRVTKETYNLLVSRVDELYRKIQKTVGIDAFNAAKERIVVLEDKVANKAEQEDLEDISESVETLQSDVSEVKTSLSGKASSTRVEDIAQTVNNISNEIGDFATNE